MFDLKMKELFSYVPKSGTFSHGEVSVILKQLIRRSSGIFPRNCTPWHENVDCFLDVVDCMWEL